MVEKRHKWIRRTSSTQSLVLISVCYAFTLGSSNFQLVDQFKSYPEAKSYCRDMYTDLATVHNVTVMNNLITLATNKTPRAWIGLETADVRTWHWSQPDQKIDFFNWKLGEPQDNDEDTCVAMDQLGKWFESECSTRRSFFCQDIINKRKHVLVAETKSWRDAQSHCRDLSSELVSIHSSEENEAVKNVSASKVVWIGLFKDPWVWSDGSNSSFRFWRPNQPNYLDDQYCTAAVFKLEGRWNDLKCTGRRWFICYGEKKTTTTPTTKTTTNTESVESNTTTISTAQSTQMMTPSEAATVLTVTPISEVTELPTTTDIITTEEESAIVTDFTSGPSTQLSRKTTEMPNLTVTQTLETMVVATVIDSITSAQSTTQSSDRIPTVSSQTSSDNLILIQENRTWIEAMSYCRENHIGLVNILSEELQDKVAEKAKSATSTHVWLGLRYTCNFGFWFWTRSTSGCYQNWNPEHGSEWEYDCGVSGALEATGRHQWVGLPEAKKLNFICSICEG